MSQSNDERWARLVLVDPRGKMLGQLPRIRAQVPFWSEVESLVRAVRGQHGVDVIIVRLLSVEGGRFMRGGLVTYLAEATGEIACEPCEWVLDEQPQRTSYAKVGGPRRDLEWAESVLKGHGLSPSGRAIQVRTWNLSSLWRIPVGAEQVWLKAVPHFFAHEGGLIAAMAPDRRVPSLLGHEPGRMLMREIPGVDLYGATLDQRLEMIELLVDLQRSWIGRVDELFALGLRDSRAAALENAIRGVLERTRRELSPANVKVLDRFLSGLGDRLEEVRACGLPDTLVHGDFHAGNLRGSSNELVLLDWGDASVGHPLLDHSAFLDMASPEYKPTLRTRWLKLWREALPGSDPERAWTLLTPVAAARAAAVYQHFLDNIEPAEHRYHKSDPSDWLEQASVLAQQEGS